MISNSSLYLYHPETPDIPFDHRYAILSVYWADTYYDLWQDYGTLITTAGNVSVSDINATADILDPSHLLPRETGGVLLEGGTFYNAWLLTGGYLARHLISDGTITDPEERLRCQWWGLWRWQRYRLTLAMQVTKLGTFGKRGLVLGTDLP